MSANAIGCGRPGGTDAAPVQCPHCGASVLLGSGCASCAGASGCAFTTCPECGHGFPNPRRSGLAYRLSLWLERRRENAASRRD